MKPILSFMTAAAVFLVGCEIQAPLRVKDWALSPGAVGFVEGEFTEGRDVFKLPLDKFKGEVGFVPIREVRTGRVLVYFAGGEGFDPRETATLQLLTPQSFRLNIQTVPTDLPPPPYLLEFGVRRGEGPSPGWPTIEGRAQFGTPLIE